MSALYLYALLGTAPRRPLPRGLAGERIRLVRCAGLVAAVGDISEPPRVSATALRRHDATVRHLARLADAVLPVRFGTLIASRAELARQLEPQAAGLREALALVTGREQMTLRVYGDRPAVSAAPDDGGNGPGLRYLAGRRRAHAAPELAPLKRALGRLVHAERVERHVSPPLVASLYHLVPRGRSGRYRHAVGKASAELNDVYVIASGPWPPYAFAPVTVA